MTSNHSARLMHAVLDGEATPAEARELEGLMDADPALRARFDAWRRMFDALGRVPGAYPPEGLVAAVMANIPHSPAGPGSKLSARSRVIGVASEHAGAVPATGHRITRPTTFLGGHSMSEQTIGSFSKRKIWIGAGIAAVAVIVVAGYALDAPPGTTDAVGTIAPAQRYVAPQNTAVDVQPGIPTRPMTASVPPAPDSTAAGLAQGQALGQAQGLAQGQALGQAHGVAQGQALGQAHGTALGQAQGQALGQAHGVAQGQALGQAHGTALGQAQGQALGQAQGQALGQAQGLAQGQALGQAKGQALGQAQGQALGQAQGKALGQAQGQALGQAQGQALGQAQGKALGQAQGKALGQAQGLAQGQALGQAQGKALGQAQGKALGQAQGQALGQAQGQALGQAQGKALGQALGQAR
ncbi:hypothetical protein BURK1_03267 [Burkholderiales bacterium]|nr:hypothetical protein BURK1_03267 [Burkholderiales bacterium]